MSESDELVHLPLPLSLSLPSPSLSLCYVVEVLNPFFVISIVGCSVALAPLFSFTTLFFSSFFLGRSPGSHSILPLSSLFSTFSPSFISLSLSLSIYFLFLFLILLITHHTTSTTYPPWQPLDRHTATTGFDIAQQRQQAVPLVPPPNSSSSSSTSQ